MNFIKKLFLPKETNLILSELESLNYYFKNDINPLNFELSYAWELSYNKAKKNILKNSKILSKEVFERVSKPNIIVLNIIANCASDEVYSTNHHVYRGILNSTGDAFKNIFYIMLKKLKELEVYSDEEIKEFKEDMDEYVKSVG